MKQSTVLERTTVTLSNRMLAQLRTFVDLGRHRGIKARKQGADLDERTLYPMIEKRGYVRYDERSDEFRATELGEAVLRLIDNTEVFIERKTPKDHYGSRMQQISAALQGTLPKPKQQRNVVTPINHKRRRKAA